jgi:peptide/nickel transport system substrate-binding protein
MKELSAQFDHRPRLCGHSRSGDSLASARTFPTTTIEKLRDAWIDAPDEAQRKRIAVEIQARAFESVPYIPTGEYYPRTAFHAP